MKLESLKLIKIWKKRITSWKSDKGLIYISPAELTFAMV